MKWIAFILFFLSSIQCIGQRGYAKDSLQIKIYSNITYQDRQAVEIKVRKVFCDYCNPTQIQYFKEEGWRIAYRERNLPENVLVNGIRKFNFHIRIAKEDFKNMTNE